MRVYCKIVVCFLFLLGISSGALADYCVASGSIDTLDPYIIAVNFNGISNSSAQESYSYNTESYGYLTLGQSYTARLTIANPSDAKCRIWVDWNQDMDFDDSGETVYSASLTTTLIQPSISVPQDAVPGFCRMRIRVCWKEDPNSCETQSGEVEDYPIYVYIEDQPFYSGGMGTIDEPYLISTPQNLNEISNHPTNWGQYFLLTNDIDMSLLAGGFKNPIGDLGTGFTGIFDGNSHAISNFSYHDTGNSFVALFGNVDSGSAQIKNLCLVNPSVSAANYVAALVGTLGTNGQPLIQNCSVKGGNIAGTKYVGGLVGHAISGQIINCYADTSVSATGNTAGGFIGSTGNTSTIIDSYSTSTVQCPNTVGGFVGTYSGQITNCYSAGLVSSGVNTGGFAGSSMGGTIQNCFWDTQTSSQPTSPAATGLDTTLMQTQSTYTNAGWDFTGTWHICEQMDYPKLQWQIPSADIACPYGVSLEDIQIISENWLLTKLSNDTNSDGIVDFIDFADFAKTYDPQNISALYDFCNQWLQYSQTAGDIAPAQSPDGVVNFADFAAIANQWLENIIAF